ncbi:hypothetical protein ACP275_13G030500 [Erythranthe tilingii]
MFNRSSLLSLFPLISFLSSYPSHSSLILPLNPKFICDGHFRKWFIAISLSTNKSQVLLIKSSSHMLIINPQKSAKIAHLRSRLKSTRRHRDKNWRKMKIMRDRG